jgi:hypothetical protein
MQRLHVTAILKCFQGRSLGKVRTNMAQKEYRKTRQNTSFQSECIYAQDFICSGQERFSKRGQVYFIIWCMEKTVNL